MGVWKSQQVYEKAGRYTPESMPALIAQVYEEESYMVPYMWAAILIYPFWPSMVSHITLIPGRISEGDATGWPSSSNWLPGMA